MKYDDKNLQIVQQKLTHVPNVFKEEGRESKTSRVIIEIQDLNLKFEEAMF